MKIENVSIALQPDVYKLFRNLKNTAANTLGEYVDNAVQSYLNNKDKITPLEPDYKLVVEILIDKDNDLIKISDNAAGIDEKNYLRAFEPAHIPTDTNGLHEFGVGMKTASVWLADRWTVKTKAFGENVERTTTFDLDEVTRNKKEDLKVKESFKSRYTHYTQIELHQLSSNAPSSAQIDKIRRHLSSIYRWYLRNNYIEIILNEVSLQAPNYEILEAPFYKDPYGELKEWKVNVSVKLGQYSAEGWIALLENMKKGQNGIVLLRNKRVVIGGDDDKNFHPDLSGSSGSHRYKRLFGELELKGFKVSFNKNSFQEVEIVDQLLHEVAVQLRKDSENILIQADNYRTKTKEEMTKIADKAINELNKQGRQARSFDEKAKKLSPDNESNTSNNSKTVNPLSKAETIGEYRYDEMITINGQKYDLITEFVDGDRSQLYSVVIDEKKNKILDCKVIHCCINLAHNFFSSYPSLKSSTDYQPLIKIFRTLAVAEVTAKDSSSIKANTVRNLFNHYI